MPRLRATFSLSHSILLPPAAWFLFAATLPIFGSVAWAAPDASIAAPIEFQRSAPEQNKVVNISLPLRDESGRAVWGVVCDNLKNTPLHEQSTLLTQLPEGWDASQVAFALTNPNGSQTDALGKSNVGRLEPLSDGKTLRYFPPLEFNFQQTPDSKAVERSSFPLTATESRIVRLSVLDKETYGQKLNATREIILKRPTVVLVHGINSYPEVWLGLNKDGLGAALAQNAFSVVALDNSGVQQNQKQPLKNFDEDAYGYYGGNGPVEFFAANLARLVQSRLQQNQRAGYVSHRVDIVAHSYGGLIARWYLKTFRLNPTPDATPILEGSASSAAVPDSRHWYVNAKNNKVGANLYSLPQWFWDKSNFPDELLTNPATTTLENLAPSTPLTWSAPAGSTLGVSSLDGSATFAQTVGESSKGAANVTVLTGSGVPVRKLITVASMWRGVPLCNYLNEIRNPRPSPNLGGRRFYDAPLTLPLKVLAPTIGKFVDGQLDAAGRLATKTPAMEVMAVNSRWLQYLNETPFNDQVEYGSVAGDYSRAIGVLKVFNFDPHTTISSYQKPSWFSGLDLERYNDGPHNLTDGVVPLWSAAISGSEVIVPAHHNGILSDDLTKNYVLTALSSDILPDGKKLNAHWGQSVISRVWDGPQKRYRTWLFKKNEMAPEPQNAMYQLVEDSGKVVPNYKDADPTAIARIAPDALTQLPLLTAAK